MNARLGLSPFHKNIHSSERTNRKYVHPLRLHEGINSSLEKSSTHKNMEYDELENDGSFPSGSSS